MRWTADKEKRRQGDKEWLSEGGVTGDKGTRRQGDKE